MPETQREGIMPLYTPLITSCATNNVTFALNQKYINPKSSCVRPCKTINCGIVAGV